MRINKDAALLSSIVAMICLVYPFMFWLGFLVFGIDLGWKHVAFVSLALLVVSISVVLGAYALIPFKSKEEE